MKCLSEETEPRLGVGVFLRQDRDRRWRRSPTPWRASSAGWRAYPVRLPALSSTHLWPVDGRGRRSGIKTETPFLCRSRKSVSIPKSQFLSYRPFVRLTKRCLLLQHSIKEIKAGKRVSVAVISIFLARTWMFLHLAGAANLTGSLDDSLLCKKMI